MGGGALTGRRAVEGVGNAGQVDDDGLDTRTTSGIHYFRRTNCCITGWETPCAENNLELSIDIQTSANV